jgi:hypothetical protein
MPHRRSPSPTRNLVSVAARSLSDQSGMPAREEFPSHQELEEGPKGLFSSGYEPLAECCSAAKVSVAPRVDAMASARQRILEIRSPPLGERKKMKKVEFSFFLDGKASRWISRGLTS